MPISLFKAREAGLATTQSAAGVAQQTANATSQNAWTQNKVATGSGSAADIDSVVSNPAITHEAEKFEIYQDAMKRMQATTDNVLSDVLQKFVAPTLVLFNTMGKFVTTPFLVQGAGSELSRGLLINSLHKVSGFVVDRVTDLYWLGAKSMNLVSASIFKVEAPTIHHIATNTIDQAHLSLSNADARVVVARSEVHRNEEFGVQAKSMVLATVSDLVATTMGKFRALAQADALVKAPVVRLKNGTEEVLLKPGAVEIHSSAGTVTIHAGGSLSIRTGSREIAITSDAIHMLDGAKKVVIDSAGVLLQNGTKGIKVTDSRVDLNPMGLVATPAVLAPHAPDATVDLDVPPTIQDVTTESHLRKTDMLPQYDGVNPVPFRSI